MIQRHRILLNPRFSTGSTTPEIASGSTLQNINGYQVSNIQGLGGGVVNEDNIRGFLNDTNNQRIIDDFFSFLTANTTTIEFAHIWHSDMDLARVFNEYYDSSVLNNQIPSGISITGALTGTTGITVVDNVHHNYDGVSPSKYLEYLPQSIDQSSRLFRVYSALTTYSTEQSYYIPVHIRRNSGMMDRQKFFFDNIQTILEQFVPTTNLPDDNIPGDEYGGGDSGDNENVEINVTILEPPPGFFDGFSANTSGSTTGSTGPEDSESAPDLPNLNPDLGGGGVINPNIIGGTEPETQTRS